MQLRAMGDLILGKASPFLNAENLRNVRRTKYDPPLSALAGEDVCVDGRCPGTDRWVRP